MRPHNTHSRDNSLRKLSLINRWLIAASITLTGVLTDVAAHAFPSKSATGSTTESSPKVRSHHHAVHHSKRPSATSSHALRPPAEAPKPVSTQKSESSPVEESPPAHESAPAPAHERAPEPEATPEPAPSHESAPVEEAPAPVVSGGS
jgi:hypothetical protein